MVLVIMGVTASGKTTIGQELARRLEWIFADGDDYHSQANREKMHEGTALSDGDRAPWLMQLHGLLEDWEENGINGVLACSALKQQYRDVLAADISAAELRFVYLDAPRELIEERAEHRNHAFATPALVGSQLQVLEVPQDAVRIEMVDANGAEKTIDEAVSEILVVAGIKTAEQWRAEA